MPGKKENINGVGIYDIIQSQILLKLEHAIESGEKFYWVKPWQSAPYPCSYLTPERPFSSPVNFLFLEAGEHLTFSQISKLHEQDPNVKIRKGAKQVYVFQQFPVFKKDENDNIAKDENGEAIIESFRLRYTREFHISDVIGIKSHFIKGDFVHDANQLTEMADQLIEDYCARFGVEAEISYGHSEAFSQGRRIVIPAKEQFKNINEYYSTVFHELGHSTKVINGRNRLNYAQEELVAELTSALLRAKLSLHDEQTERNSIAYLLGWHKRIKDAGAKDIYFAIVDAQKAVDLILDSSQQVRERLEPNILSLEDEKTLKTLDAMSERSKRCKTNR